MPPLLKLARCLIANALRSPAATPNARSAPNASGQGSAGIPLGLGGRGLGGSAAAPSHSVQEPEEEEYQEMQSSLFTIWALSLSCILGGSQTVDAQGVRRNEPLMSAQKRVQLVKAMLDANFHEVRKT